MNSITPQKLDIFLNQFLNAISLNPLGSLFWLLISKISPFLPSLPLSKIMALITFVIGMKRILVGKVIWKDQVILVTGGMSGIGSELVKLLKAKGARVLILDILKPVDPIDNYFQCDLSNPDDIDRVCQEISQSHSITMLVNNAGKSHFILILIIIIPSYHPQKPSLKPSITNNPRNRKRKTISRPNNFPILKNPSNQPPLPLSTHQTLFTNTYSV